MKKRLLALTIAVVLLLPLPAFASEANFVDLYEASVYEAEKDQPITRAKFCMLTFEAFRQINGGIFPLLEAKNIFLDVGEEPEDIFIVMLCGMGIVNGVSNNSFMPRRYITRQEACTILTRAQLLQNPDLAENIPGVESSLATIKDADTIASWAKVFVAYQYQNGVIDATDGVMSPNGTLTTEEAISMCSRFVK